jgi:hypothetical protein
MLEKKSGGWIGPFNHKELELTNEWFRIDRNYF